MDNLEKRGNSIQNKVYTALRNSIMGLQLKPGAEMSTQEIATKLCVSRTPVREAFIRLERDELVMPVPQKGTVVRHINLERVRQERFIRESLECAVLEEVIKHCTDGDINALQSAVEKHRSAVKANNQEDAIKFDNDFHNLLFKIGREPLGWEIISNISTHYFRIRLLTIWTPDIAYGTVRQHADIINAIAKKNIEESRACMKNHLHKLEMQVVDVVKNYPAFFEQDAVPDIRRFETLLSK